MKPRYNIKPNNAWILDDPFRELTDKQRAHAREWYKNHKSYFEVTK